MSRTLLIGAGAMGGAILKGALEAGLWAKEEVDVLVKRLSHAQEIQEEYGLHAMIELPFLGDYDCIVLGVKPQVLPSLLDQMDQVIDGTTLISIAAGFPLAKLEEAVPQGHWYRVMPNTPASVGLGMTAICVGKQGTEEETQMVVSLFEGVGQTAVVSEETLDRMSTIAGCGPGYLAIILDALADAGVRIGLPRQLAIQCAAQTMYGTGAWALQTGLHPALLRDQVTSPGGTTIAGIAAMEEHGIRSAIQAGVLAALKRNEELGK